MAPSKKRMASKAQRDRAKERTALMKSTRHRERVVLSPFDPEELLTIDELIAQAISRADRHAQSSELQNSGTTPAGTPNPKTRVTRRSIAPESLRILRDRVIESIQACGKATVPQSAAENQAVPKGPRLSQGLRSVVPPQQPDPAVTAGQTRGLNKKKKRRKRHPPNREENATKGGFRPMGNNLVWVPPKGVANANESRASFEPAKKKARG